MHRAHACRAPARRRSTAASAASSRTRRALCSRALPSPSRASSARPSDTVVTNESGIYLKERLLPGTYEVKAELTGFKTAVVPAVRVSVDTQTPLNIKLGVGQLSETVEVTGGSARCSRPIAPTWRRRSIAKQITDLPVLDRNFTKFILLTPGTQQLGWQHAASENPQGSTQTMVNGQNFSGTGYQLDGTENRDPILGIIVINPNLEAIGETKITSQNYDAEFGQATAGVVSVQTKSGTQRLPRQRLRVLPERRVPGAQPVHAADQESQTGRFLPETKRNQFGGSLGGPIQKDRVVHLRRLPGHAQQRRRLAAADACRRRRRATAISARTASTSTIRRAARPGAAHAVCRTTSFPASQLSPQAQAILKLIPLPNLPGTENGTRDNFVASGSETFNDDTFDVPRRRPR